MIRNKIQSAKERWRKSLHCMEIFFRHYVKNEDVGSDLQTAMNYYNTYVDSGNYVRILPDYVSYLIYNIVSLIYTIADYLDISHAAETSGICIVVPDLICVFRTIFFKVVLINSNCSPVSFYESNIDKRDSSSSMPQTIKIRVPKANIYLSKGETVILHTIESGYSLSFYSDHVDLSINGNGTEMLYGKRFGINLNEFVIGIVSDSSIYHEFQFSTEGVVAYFVESMSDYIGELKVYYSLYTLDPNIVNTCALIKDVYSVVGWRIGSGQTAKDIMGMKYKLFHINAAVQENTPMTVLSG